MKKIIQFIPFVILVLIATSAFSQPEIEEVPMFGTTRTINSTKTHKIEIKNTGATDLIITSIQFPENVKVSVDKKTIPSKNSAILLITFDHESVKADNYAATLKVISEQLKPGLKTTYESTYDIKGSFIDK
jgi:regulator of protease activity HflC (stomatin/prohibitin superfamily)